MQKRFSFGIGTIFSLIVIYFIYLYSRDHGWDALAFVSKWYLIIIGGVIAISMGIVILALLFSLSVFLFALLKMRSMGRKMKKHKHGFIDADFEVKE